MDGEKPKRKKRKFGAERILHEARLNPSPFSKDPRQLDLMDAVKDKAFADLDREIQRILNSEI